MKRYSNEAAHRFSTFFLSGPDGLRRICGAHVSSVKQPSREFSAGDLFQFVNTAGDAAEDIHSFPELLTLFPDPDRWCITYDGAQPDSAAALNPRKICAVSALRSHYGLELAGTAKRRILPDETEKAENQVLRRTIAAALQEHICALAKISWAEVSGALEHEFRRALTISDILDPYVLQAQQIFPEIDVDLDEFHYYRPRFPGTAPVRKIAYGTMQFSGRSKT